MDDIAKGIPEEGAEGGAKGSRGAENIEPGVANDAVDMFVGVVNGVEYRGLSGLVYDCDRKYGVRCWEGAKFAMGKGLYACLPEPKDPNRLLGVPACD